MTQPTKTCFKCDRMLPLADFYKHPRMADGHLNKCKSCTKADVRKHRRSNPSKVRAYDRRRYRNNPKRRAYINRRAQRERARHPERTRARNAVSNAIRDGHLTRPDACDRCNQCDSRIEAHHDDYTRPLDVRWLCSSCHSLHHAPDEKENT